MDPAARWGYLGQCIWQGGASCLSSDSPKVVGNAHIMIQEEHSDMISHESCIGVLFGQSENCGRDGGKGLTFLENCWVPGPVPSSRPV